MPGTKYVATCNLGDFNKEYNNKWLADTAAWQHKQNNKGRMNHTVTVKTVYASGSFADAIGATPLTPATGNPTSWDEDGNGVPDSIQAPTSSPPRTTTPTNSSGGGGGSSTPSVAYPYNVALKSGISHGEMNEFLKKTLRDYNQKNGTSFWVTPNGMRVNGTGAYMSPGQQQAFNSTIPVHAVDYKYGKAIDKALGGDATDIKNLDKFFFGAERPAGGYSKEYLTKEKEARGMGITVAELDKRNAAKAAAAAKPKEAAPVASTTSSNNSNSESDSQAAKKPEPKNEEKQSDKVFDKGGFGPNLPNGGVLPNTAVTKDDKKQKEDKEDKKTASNVQDNNSEDAVLASTHSKDSVDKKEKENKKVNSAAQGEADEKQQQALAMATANKQSAKEARLKKIMEMRKPYMGGAASVSSSSDAMVVPLITPASQVPPPPLP